MKTLTGLTARDMEYGFGRIVEQKGFYISVFYADDMCTYLFPRCLRNKSFMIYLPDSRVLTRQLYEERTAFLGRRVITESHGLGRITDQDDTSFTVTYTFGPVRRYAYHDIPEDAVTEQELSRHIDQEEAGKSRIWETVPEYYGGERFRSADDMHMDADRFIWRAQSTIPADGGSLRRAICYGIAFGLKPDDLLLKTWEALLQCDAPKLVIRDLYRAECIDAPKRDALLDFIDGMVTRKSHPLDSLYLQDQVESGRMIHRYLVTSADAEEIIEAMDADAAMDKVLRARMIGAGIGYEDAINEIVSVRKLREGE